MKIKMKNFLSYVNQTIEIDNNMNCFFGLNGAGKSNIIKSIYFLKEKHINIYNKYINIERKGNDENDIIIELEINNSKYIVNKIIEYIFELFSIFIDYLSVDQQSDDENLFNVIDNYKKMKDDISKEFKNYEQIIIRISKYVSLEGKNKLLFELKNDNNKNIKLLFINNEFYEFLYCDKNIFDNDYLYEDLYTDIDWDEFINKIFNIFITWEYKDTNDIDVNDSWEIKENKIECEINFNNISELNHYSCIYKILTNFDKSNNKKYFNDQNVLDNLGNNDIDNLNDKINKFLNNSIVDAWPEFSKKEISLKLEKLNSNYRYLISLGVRTRNTFDKKSLNLESDGVKRFLSIILELCFINAEDLYIFIDEPENHLHLSAITHLFELLLKLSNRFKLFIFTHSPEFFKILDKKITNFLVYFSNNNDFSESNIQKIDLDYRNKFDSYNDMFREIFGKNMIWNDLFLSHIIFVEGSSDSKLFNKLSLIWNKNLLFLPLNGCDIVNMIDFYKNFFKWKDENLKKCFLFLIKIKVEMII